MVIVGSDNIEINQFIDQILTSIDQPLEEIAAASVNTLFNIIENEDQLTVSIKVFNPSPKIGETT